MYSVQDDYRDEGERLLKEIVYRDDCPNEEYEEEENVYTLEVPKKYGVVCYFRKHNEVTKNSIWNVLASMRTGSNLIHSEFYFTKHNVTISIDSQYPVYLRRGGNAYWIKDNWEGWVIWLPKKVYYDIYKTCTQQLGTKFDLPGICCFDFRECCSVPFGYNWICSRLMAYALVKAAVLPPYVNYMRTTPAQLRDHVRTIDDPTIIVEPYTWQ